MDKEKRQYAISSEMSIEFEVDGPYKVGGLGGWAGRKVTAALAAPSGCRLRPSQRRA